MSDPAPHPGASPSPPPKAKPLKVALIGGSGLGETFRAEGAAAHEPDTPFGRPSAPIVEAELDGVRVLLLARHGPGHILPPAGVPYRANIFALKELGATHILASGAVGSLRDEYRPRDLVIPDQLIDRTTRRPQTFYEKAAVHVEFAEPFCPVLRRLLREAAAGLDATVHHGGCYVCIEGPAFSSRAESHMHRLWGGDLVGMTLLPEARLAREAELPYAAICLVTDYDSWRPPAQEGEGTPDATVLLEEIIGNLKQSTASAMALLRGTISLMSRRQADLENCPASRALELGIWSDKRQIDPREVQRLWPLWGGRFQRELAEVSPAPATPGRVD
jgi:5'-methylthioadenosine phosphorylase